MNYQIKFIIGEKHERRGVAFLISEDKKINAHKFYFDLDEYDTIRQMLNVRFDNWKKDRHPKNIVTTDGIDQILMVTINNVLYLNIRKTDCTVSYVIPKKESKI